MTDNSGTIVKTSKGHIGRTYDNKGVINGKVPVYLLVKGESDKYQKVAMLCRPETLTVIGFID